MLAFLQAPVGLKGKKENSFEIEKKNFPFNEREKQRWFLLHTTS
jgi:hypothetical protein